MNIKKSPYLSSVESMNAPNFVAFPVLLAISPSTASSIVPPININPPIRNFPKAIKNEIIKQSIIPKM